MYHLKISHLPTGRDKIQRANKRSASNENLLEQVLATANVKQAWQQVRRNKGVAGVDNLSIDGFAKVMRPQWRKIKALILDGKYRPQPVKRVRIPKDDESERLLGIPCVIDRLIQQSIVQVLSPLFDPTFSEHSYGFRPKRSAKDAVKEVQEYCQKKRQIAVDIDLSKFFDRVNHDFLMTLLERRIQDKGLLKLIGRYLRAGILDKNQFKPSHEGVPQGSPLSPLLSNIMLDLLDKELEQRGHHFARYADDVIIMVKSLRAGRRVLASLTRFIEEDLKLKVNTQKSQVVNSRQSKFLGFSFKGKHIGIHPKSLAKFKHQVRELTGRSWGVPISVKIRKLKIYLRGWINYFGIANEYNLVMELDGWIRRRIRMCYWKQWRWPRTKIRNLVKLGMPLRTAICCGISSKSYWRNAKTPCINKALGKQYLKEQGLFSLRDGWIKCHYG